MSERQGHGEPYDDSSSYDDTVLPEQTSDDTDEGWGERHDDQLSDEERLIREKPPHW